MSKEYINYYDEETAKDMIAVAVDSLFGNFPRDPNKVFPHIVLPAKHGRLIDADAFIKQNEEGFEEPLMQGEDQIGIRKIPMDAVSRAIENAPTVLEASDGVSDT